MPAFERSLTIAAALAFAAPAPARAAGNALLGTWEIVEAAPAPWADRKERAALAAEGRRLLKMQITFAAGEVIARHKTLACRKAVYEPTDYAPDALFQGGLSPTRTRSRKASAFRKATYQAST